MKLLPCPFCGGRKTIKDSVPNTQGNRRFIWCLDCNMHGPWSFQPRTAEEVWNTRASQSEAVQQGDPQNPVENAVDARRYRWLRDGLCENYADACDLARMAYQGRADELDAAIDAAMRSSAPKGKADGR